MFANIEYDEEDNAVVDLAQNYMWAPPEVNMCSAEMWRFDASIAHSFDVFSVGASLLGMLLGESYPARALQPLVYLGFKQWGFVWSICTSKEEYYANMDR